MFAVIIFGTHMPDTTYKAAEANTCEKRSSCSAAVEVAETSPEKQVIIVQ